MFAYKKGSVNIFGDPNNGARKYIIISLMGDGSKSGTVSGADFGIFESLILVIISIGVSFFYIRKNQKSFFES